MGRGGSVEREISRASRPMDLPAQVRLTRQQRTWYQVLHKARFVALGASLPSASTNMTPFVGRLPKSLYGLR